MKKRSFIKLEAKAITNLVQAMFQISYVLLP